MDTLPTSADNLNKQPSFLARKTFGQPNYFLLAMLAAFLLALMPRGARKAVEGNTNKAEDWLPPGYAESVDLRWFRDHFIGEQFALVSWDGCTLGDTEKLEKLARSLTPTDKALAKAAPDSDLRERAEWYSHIITGPQVLDQLIEASQISYGEAIRRVEGALVGPRKVDENGKKLGNDSRTTCLIVYLTEAATTNNRIMRQAVEKIAEIAESECGIAPESLHMGGPPVDNITIDIEGERTLVRLAGLSGIVGLSLSFWCFRSIKLTGIVFAVGVLSAGMSLAIVFYFGVAEVMFTSLSKPRLGTVDAILMSMPAVVYVLGLSGAIHIVNYYRDARRDSGLHDAAETAVRLGWGPCLLAAFTTAVGLGSLYTSDILPIKKFGMFTAGAVLLTVAVLFTILPVFLHRFPVSDDLIKRQSGGHGGRDESHLPDWAKRLFGFVIGRHALTCAMWFVIMGVFAFGFTKIETSVSLLKLLDQDTDLIHDYAWLETNLGNLVPMEIVLTVPEERKRSAEENAEDDGQQYRMTMLEMLNMIREMQARVEQLPEVSRNMSIATYAPESTDVGVSSANRSGDWAKNEGLEESREQLLDTGYLRVEQLPNQNEYTQGRELWRLSARVAALGNDAEGVDYGDFVKELKKAVDPVLVAYQQRDMIVEQLHKAGKKLDGAKLWVLYRSSEEDGPLQPGAQEAVLANLLKRSGVDTLSVKAEGGVSRIVPTYNLSTLDKRKDDQEYMDRAIATLSKQDALVLVSASSDPRVKEFVHAGLHVIDVTDVPVYETSAAIPLATDGGPRPIRAVYTGMIPLVYKTQRQLLVSLNESIMWATVLIAVVMMFVLRSPMAGLISMIPNVFPIVIIFGGLGWLGIKVDIGIMMTASVALGVAVDDTVHFLTWFRRGTKQGLDRVRAVMLAYDRCATAMLQTTIIGGLGLAVFATSTFTPTQQFGYLMISMLGAALVGDLLLLPAILASPLGKFFGGDAPEPGESMQWSQAPTVHETFASAVPVSSPTTEIASTTPAPTLPTSTPPVSTTDEAMSAVDKTVEPVEPEVTQTPPSDAQQQELLEGPHAALHAKLRSLRRGESTQDSVSH